MIDLYFLIILVCDCCLNSKIIGINGFSVTIGKFYRYLPVFVVIINQPRFGFSKDLQRKFFMSLSTFTRRSLPFIQCNEVQRVSALSRKSLLVKMSQFHTADRLKGL
jgi:hypothetical protein